MPKTEVRRLLKQQRSERQKEKHVEHPFAKYDAQDQLTCVVCNSQVKSAWSAHLGSAFHKENMARLRALKQQKQQPQQRPVKRTSSPVSEQQELPTKRAKHHVQEDEEMDGDDDNNETSQLPADFFDGDAASAPQQSSSESEQEEEELQQPDPTKKEKPKPTQPPQLSGASSNLPQGFFDDPEEEARMRKEAPIAEQVENILDEEYALFKEAMADTIIEAEKVDEEEDEELWLDRDEEMFRQQAEFDSRVEMLKKMRAKTAQGEFSAPNEEKRGESRPDYDDVEREIRTGLKTGVRNVLKKAPAKKVTTVFDDMDVSSDEEDEEDDDWRAQQL
ncbi:hypothetical protein BDA99DRAFT_493064 [Phascolomyces articulosus]|uniref:ZNF380 coiled-coil domain-containing protein n=1 Tax=Phascolomyces articulosus TaxID=60185 RepID=A0AAD5KS28_9FUNG|nr:hypothetical protein BDA99DRAFT_493064 [Phascolomyces articulosus]